MAWSVVAVTLLLFGLTANYSTTSIDQDALTNTITARQFGKTGAPFAPGWVPTTDHPGLTLGFFTETDNGPVSVYPPGAALVGAPLYVITPAPLKTFVGNLPSGEALALAVPPAWQATATAVITSSLTMGLFALVCREVGADPRAAARIAVFAAVATSVWSVAASSLFVHGPSLLFLMSAVLCLIRGRLWWAGLALGAAVLVRPHVAIPAAAIGLYLAARRRSILPITAIGIGSSLGALLYLAYTVLVFGSASPSAGYGSNYISRLISLDLWDWAVNLAGALFSPRWGVMVAAPFLWTLVPALRQAWRHATPEIRAAIIGGVVYFLVQFKIHRYNPGLSTLYRYPLEAMALASPLLVVAWMNTSAELRDGRFHWLATRLSIAAQAVFSILR